MLLECELLLFACDCVIELSAIKYPDTDIDGTFRNPAGYPFVKKISDCCVPPDRHITVLGMPINSPGAGPGTITNGSLFYVHCSKMRIRIQLTAGGRSPWIHLAISMAYFKGKLQIRRLFRHSVSVAQSSSKTVCRLLLCCGIIFWLWTAVTVLQQVKVSGVCGKTSSTTDYM